MPRTITSTFNIFDTGRHYTGKQRNYLLDNVKKVVNSGAVQERLKLRQLYGYAGHALRELSGKMALSAKEVIRTPSGQEMVVDATPACVTTGIKIDGDGNVTHTQEVLDNDEGKKIWALHQSKVGGFSWAAKGGVKGGHTILDDLFGFDYVPDPLFATNKGWVMDSEQAGNVASRQQILDALKKEGLSKPGSAYDGWVASIHAASEAYQEKIADQEASILDANNKIIGLEHDIDTRDNEIARLKRELRAAESRNSQLIADNVGELERTSQHRQYVFSAFADSSTIKLPDQVLDALVNAKSVESLQPVHDFLLATARIRGENLPVGAPPKAEYVKSTPVFDNEGESGVLGSGLDMPL